MTQVRKFLVTIEVEDDDEREYPETLDFAVNRFRDATELTVQEDIQPAVITVTEFVPATP